MKCVYCGSDAGEKDVCAVCADYIAHRNSGTQAAFSWDGGTLQAGDVMRELSCDLYTAKQILTRFGFKTSTYQGISLREFRLRQLGGDITAFLSGRSSENRIQAAIKLLQDNGYKVEKEDARENFGD